MINHQGKVMFSSILRFTTIASKIAIAKGLPVLIMPSNVQKEEGKPCPQLATNAISNVLSVLAETKLTTSKICNQVRKIINYELVLYRQFVS